MEGSNFDLPCDVFISAIGQRPMLLVSLRRSEIKRGNVFAAEPRTLTNIPEYSREEIV